MILKGMFRWRMHFQTFINNKQNMQSLIILETTIVFRSNNRTIFKEP